MEPSDDHQVLHRAPKTIIIHHGGPGMDYWGRYVFVKTNFTRVLRLALASTPSSSGRCSARQPSSSSSGPWGRPSA